MQRLKMISLVYTTARPHLAKQQIDLWLCRARDLNQVEVILCLDDGFTAYVPIPNVRIVYNYDKKNCVSGWNTACRYASGDIIVQVSDDLEPPLGWDWRIEQRLLKTGALAISDGLSASLNFLPHSIISRDIIMRQGYLFHDSYSSMFCDNEFTDTMKLRGLVVNALDLEFKHKNGEFKDDVAKRHNSFYNSGREIYEYRKSVGFKRYKYFRYDITDDNSDGMYSPRLGVSLPYFKCPKTVKFYLDSHVKSYNVRMEKFGQKEGHPDLEVLIPTIEARKEHLNTLLLELKRQGVSYLIDDGSGTTGEKRNRLIRNSKAKYITFVDDDDWISHDYGEKIGQAIKSNTDVVLYDVMCNIEQNDPRLAVLEVNGSSNTNDGIFNRIANHLMVWKRELALEVKFSNITFGEDTDWAVRINPLVKSWSRIHSILYFYENIKKSNPSSYVHKKQVVQTAPVNILKLSTKERQALRFGLKK